MKTIPLLNAEEAVDDAYRWLEIHESEHWRVQLNENQSYFGRAVFWLKRRGAMQNLSDISLDEWRDLQWLLKRYERTLERLGPNHWNYAWLGNLFHEHGGHGHLHVIPRYQGWVMWNKRVFTDTRWGKDYKPRKERKLKRDVLECLVDDMRKWWDESE